MLHTRVVTALALAVVFIAALFWLPRAAWVGLAGVLLVLAALEWAGLARVPPLARAAYAALLVALLAALLALPGAGGWAYHGAAVFWLLLAPLWLLRRPAFNGPWLPLAAGVVVLVPAFHALVELRDMGPAVLLSSMVLVWISDSAAYFAGRRYGRHKLAPAVSPGKTWEGVAGALLAVAVYGIAWLALSGDGARVWPTAQPVLLLALFFVLAAAGIVGDLLESLVKRAAGVKDSGRLLPGHGGLLDRIDALTAVLPLSALAMRLMD